MELIEGVVLSTSPKSEETHWKQTIFLLDKEYEVKEGEIINGMIKAVPNKNNYRALDIKIYFQTNTMKKT